MKDKTMSSPETKSEELLQTFAQGRIGEIITAIVGNDVLQRRFEAHPEFQQEEFEGKPSGIIALDLGIINNEVKDALLITQAAARTIAVIEGTIEAKDMNDDLFKFVGSERDSHALQKAQADWQLSNGIEHDEYSTDTFKRAAVNHIHAAATILDKQDKFSQEARQLRTMANTVQERVIGLDLVNQPSTYAALILKEVEGHADTEWLNHLKKLSDIATNQDDIPLKVEPGLEAE